MNVAVRHNGSTITSRVISYEREHKICSGIGTLTVILEGTYSTSIDPWDTFDIYENGDFKVRYYVSQASRSIPEGTITVECQDISKKVVDYFIPNSYTVDYPSFNKYWIIKFLDEMNLNYEFTTSQPGTLLSNYTQLGLVSAYDQLQTLLQMSGWYMYFDGNGKAIIGSLNVNFADSVATVNKTDILDIKKISNDKMLRNKAMVFGAYDPYLGTNAKASVTVHTPWNYDHNDIRTVVISNSNIGDKSTAAGMANQIVKEFAKITVEKHISLWGARDINLGTALRVYSGIWNGRGLVTTFGVSMSSSGLITKVILDERCPRLFGFFDFGDYVYVATYGDGVWRKHIKYDPTWYNFSTGLTNLAITDMHINEGVFGSVSTSGDAYYAIDNLPWHNLVVSGFESAVDDDVTGDITASGMMTTFSGLMARAVIVDKQTNVVKYAVDNASGINYGDYFLDNGYVTVSGIIASGVTASGIGSNDFSGKRSWIAAYDVLAGEMIPTVYPVSLSGRYAYTIMDIENDGINDYVSVATSGGGGVVGPDGNYGQHYSQAFASTKDYLSTTIYPNAASIEEINSIYRGNFESISMRVQNENSLVAVDNQISRYSAAVAIGKDQVARKNSFARVYDGINDKIDVQRTATTSSATTNLGRIIGIYPQWGIDLYRVYHVKFGSSFASEDVKFYYRDWDAYTNVWGSDNLISTYTLPGGGTGFGATGLTYDVYSDGTNIYFLTVFVRHQDTIGTFSQASHLYICLSTVGLELSTVTNDDMLEYITESLDGMYYYICPASEPDNGTPGSTFSNPLNFHIFQKDNGVQIIGRVELFRNDNSVHDDKYSTKEIVFYGNNTVVQYNEIYSDTQVMATYSPIRRFSSIYEGNWTQLTSSKAIINGQGSVGSPCFVFDGATFLTYTAVGGTSIPNYIPFYYYKDTVRPVFANNGNLYIAQDPDTLAFYVCSADSLELSFEIVPPDGIYLYCFIGSAIGTGSGSIYSIFYDANTELEYIAPYNFSSFDLGRKIAPNAGSFHTVPSISNRAIAFGNFFIEDDTYIDYQGATNPIAGVTYIDLGIPDSQTTIYQVLRRDNETEYTLIQEEAYPIRLDISQNSPLVTVGSGSDSYQSNYVYESSLVTVQAVPSGALITGGHQVNDYRYAYLEPAYGGVTSSGLEIQETILSISSGIIYGSDALTYASGFMMVYEVPSGYNGTRIETSNRGIGGQYIFITAAGVTQEFFQKNPGDFEIFTMYSGMPQARCTIIRLDDSM